MRATIWAILLVTCRLAYSHNGPLDISPLSFSPLIENTPYPALKFHRRDGLSLGNLTSSNSSTLEDAQRIVRAAQDKARRRNPKLISSPRNNVYQFSPEMVDAPTIQSNGTVIDPLSDGTAVNGTVSQAAAIVAEALAKNETSPDSLLEKRASSYWMENMVQNGASPYAPSGYKVWRNVKDYGAVGNGVADDTAAINKAITDGNRCGQACGTTSTLQAVVYFPAGTYLVSGSIVAYYFTQIIGDATNPPTIKVSPAFSGLGVISSDVYIEGGNSAVWYINTSNFYRQVRNFIIDMTSGPLDTSIAGIHWQVSQATSLQNIKFKMSTTAGNNQQGIYMENGSGGFMSDLEFTGGAIGAYVGNQQFTTRNLKFSNHLKHAIEIHWDWGWTWKGVDISNCPLGIYLWSPEIGTLGSAIFIDSTLTNVPVGIQVQAPSASGNVTMNLFSVQTNNVPTIVQYDSGANLLRGSSGSQMVTAWGIGKRYDTKNGEASGVWQGGADYARAPEISPVLLKVAGNPTSGFFERSKPQYETLAASQFINAKTAYGAVGNGVADDTAALNSAFAASASSGKVLWIPAGVYIVTDTVLIPSGTKVVGQLWSQIMGSGTKFSSINSPYPVIKVGNVGDRGSVEIQDLLFTVRGGTAGAIVLEWNIHESTQGSAAMWDTHVRVGGAVGSNLQATNCPKLASTVKSACIAGSMLVHITSKASAYFENNWFWVADHDLDLPAATQIDVFVGRGFLIEGSGPVWLYGTASEHSVMYQYQTVDASNIFMAMIQTESPYYQVQPVAPKPFGVSTYFPSDPDFGSCNATSVSCAVSWGVRIINSDSIYIYGSALYSWFSKYGQACVDTENCQDRIFEISSSSDIWIYSLITKASVEMISPDGGISVLGKDNKVNYCDIVMAWLGGAGGDGLSGGVVHRSPISGTVIPFPATTVAATATFTISGPVVSQIDFTANDGNQNTPVGPGKSNCQKCDLSRLITSTCCGVGGGMSNPVEIGAGTPIPRAIILPAGFIPNQAVTGDDGVTHPAGQPFPGEVIVPIGTVFPVPFRVPAGLPLSNTWSPDADDDGSNNSTLYLVPNFWTGPLTVSCDYPCTLVFPPVTTTTTWLPPPFLYTTGTITTTITPPPYTTELVRISRTVVSSGQGSMPTKTIAPQPAPTPLCFELDFILFKIDLCPPQLKPFPIPIPSVTITPIPPGGKSGPTTEDNRPTKEESREEEEEQEEENDEDGGSCPVDFDLGDDPDDEDVAGGDYLGIGADSGPTTSFAPPAAGTGAPVTVTVTATVQTVRTVTVDVTSTVVISPPAKATTTQPASTPTAAVPNKNDETYYCFTSGASGERDWWDGRGQQFCKDFGGHTLDAMPGASASASWLAWSYNFDWSGYAWAYTRVDAKRGCKFVVDQVDCSRIMSKIAVTCPNWGGHMEGNCATWLLDPGSHLYEGGAPPGNGDPNPS